MEDEIKYFIVIVYIEDGLECVMEFMVVFDYVLVFLFMEELELNIVKGVVIVSYVLNLNGCKDELLIIWYRCMDRNGIDRFLVFVFCLNELEYFYMLVKEDVGYYLMVVIVFKYLCCLLGEEWIVVFNFLIKKG